MHIRPARDDDFDAIAALTNHYIRATAVHFGCTPQPADELRQSWLAARDRYPFLVIESPDLHGRFAGFAKAGRWRERDAYAWTAEVGIYIVPEAHGKGLGKALYLALIDECRRCGFHTLVGGITLPNDPSCKLHESCGFTRVATFQEVGWKFNTWHSVAFYQLALESPDLAARPLTQPQ